MVHKRHNIMSFYPLHKKSTAESRLESFIASKALRYGQMRNFDFGELKKNYVSGLSPAITRRIITEEQVIKLLMNAFKLNKIEKFVQEICWRTYWKGYLEHRGNIWSKYLADISNLSSIKTEPDYKQAISGKTGVDCFDHWVEELKRTGYLHNHCRMWFASIWVFSLKLPWQLGAEFFLRYLIDGDSASNTLSWRWVAGLHTKGKAYLAFPGNIRKYTSNRFEKLDGIITEIKEYTFEDEIFEIQAPNLISIDSKKVVNCLLIHENDLSLENLPKSDFIIIQKEGLDLTGRSRLVKRFINDALNDCINRAKDIEHSEIHIVDINDESELIDICKEIKVNSINTPYPSVGFLKNRLDYINEKTSLNFKYFNCNWDKQFWPHSSKGFFKLKNKIEPILKNYKFHS